MSSVIAGKSFELFENIASADLHLTEFHNDGVTDQFECFAPFPPTLTFVFHVVYF